MVFIGTPFALGYAAWARRVVPERRIAMAALVLSVLECVGLAALVLNAALDS